MTVEFVPAENPINRVSPALLQKIKEAQNSAIERNFKSAGEFCEAACRRSGVPEEVARAFDHEGLFPFADLAHAELVARLEKTPAAMSLSASARTKLADNIQLVRAFAVPDNVIEAVRAKVERVVDGFPRAPEHLERGKNPGDVIDPFLISATQYLLCEGSIEHGIEAGVIHKCMMMLEDLLGNLHQDVIGTMRGNVRAPEPKGEALHPVDNPFPGADLVQPPLKMSEPLRFHQLKSKTGSAKGGDGKRLGDQFNTLVATYGGETYHSSILGTTLVGHRSRGGISKVAQDAVFLVGKAALTQLTRSPTGGELLMRVYQSAFQDVARAKSYSVKEIAGRIAAEFKQRSERADGLLDTILDDVTKGQPADQDSRLTPKKKPKSAKQR